MRIPARLPPLEAANRAGQRRLGDAAGTSAPVVAMSLPRAQRDLRLDLFRGLANWAMFLGHIPSTVLAWLTFRHFGFSDGADLFVFISGYTSGIVYIDASMQHDCTIDGSPHCSERLDATREPEVSNMPRTLSF
jgi:OpgC protein